MTLSRKNPLRGSRSADRAARSESGRRASGMVDRVGTAPCRSIHGSCARTSKLSTERGQGQGVVTERGIRPRFFALTKGKSARAGRYGEARHVGGGALS